MNTNQTINISWATTGTSIQSFPSTPQKEETNMSYERDYLVTRLNEVYYQKTNDLTNKHHIGHFDGPRTYKELLDWIKKGKYILDEKRIKYIDACDDDIYHNCLDGIIWTGCGWNPEDEYKKYEVSYADLRTTLQKAKDIIKTQDKEKGLAALQEFEAWTSK